MSGAFTQAVDTLVDTDISMLSDTAMRVEFLEVRRMIDRLESYAARLLVGVHGRGIPAGDGASSTPVWVQAQTGQRVSEAKASLAAGQACDSLPLTAKAWAQGEISASAAHTICHGQRPGHEDVYTSIEDTLVGYAASRDVRGLDSMIRHYQTRVDALDDRDPSDRNQLHLSHSGNRWIIDGDLDELAGATIDTAILAATDKPAEGDDRTPSKRRADALTTVCRFFLDHADLPVEGGEAPHVSIIVNWDTIQNGVPATIDGDLALTPADIGQLLCDANISRVVIGPDSIPLDVGRTMRHPSKGLRRAVVIRDQHCRFPGCTRRPGWSQVHHSPPWEHGGETKLDHLVLVCSYHHHLVHKPGWSAAFDGTTFTVTRPNGERLGSA
jgi:hypothetical protein